MNTFSKRTLEVILIARKLASLNGKSEIDSLYLLYGILKHNKNFASKALTNVGVTLKELEVNSNIYGDKKEELEEVVDLLIKKDTILDETFELTFKIKNTPFVDAIFLRSGEIAENCNSKEIGTHHVLLSLISFDEGMSRRFLNTIGVKVVDILKEILQAHPSFIGFDKLLGDSDQDAKNDDVGIEACTTDLNEQAQKGTFDKLVGRSSEISSIIEVLSRRKKNNVCLIGEAGVGKTAIVEGLAKLLEDGDVPASMNNKRIISLDLCGLLAGTKYRGEFEEKIKKLIDDVSEDEDVILFIDEIHTLVGAGAGENSLDAANILKPALARGSIQVIGATTLDEYKAKIEPDSALERRFKPIIVSEPSVEETVAILKGIKDSYENFHNIEISDEVIETCVYLSSRYLHDRVFPDKAIDVLDEACASLKLRIKDAGKSVKREENINSVFDFEDKYMKKNRMKDWKLFIAEELKKDLDIDFKEIKNIKENRLTEEAIIEVISKQTKIPVNKLSEKERAKLLKLESRLNKAVVGQSEAVRIVANTVKRVRAGISSPDHPNGTLLFCGPTGVGKTELAKCLAEELFSSRDSLITIDMTEYMHSHTVSRLIGSPPGYVGYGEGGQLTEKVRRNPYSIILFDEIEKAHPDIFNILLQILDVGIITDANGRKINFTNCTIIMTSNIGSNIYTKKGSLGFGTANAINDEYENMKNVIHNEIKRVFKPEFINRIDSIVIFKSLGEEELVKITDLLLSRLEKNIFEMRGIKLSFTEGVKKLVVASSYEEGYGARPLSRGIQRLIENPLSEVILKNLDKKIKTIKCKKKNTKDIVFNIEGGN